MESGVYLLLLLLALNLNGYARAQLDINVVETDEITHEWREGILFISMHEEIPAPFTFASFTYEGTPSFSVSYPNENPNTYLGLSIESEGSRHSLQIKIQQDYENTYFGTAPPQYVFTVTAGTTITTVSLNLVNINDNAPILQATTSCSIEENTLQRSTCEYIIRDEDGHVMDATWTLSNDGDYYFNFHEDEVITDNTIKERTLILEPKVELDFENTTIHIMDWTVTDEKIVDSDVRRSGTARAVVQVIDMPDTPPTWTTIFASQGFVELEPQTFTVRAVDGDVGVNDEINYMQDDSYNDLISIDEFSGVISVEGIDRDELDLDILEFMIFACEVHDPGYCINQTIIFIVEDTNNQFPLITITTGETEIRIPENSFDDLNIDMYAHDRDTGQNAMYNVWLSAEHNQQEAFTVAPSTGYQRTTLYMYITNYQLLDYDRVETWRDFELTIFTQDFTEPNNLDFKIFHVTLINLNDEIPYFVELDPDTSEYETVFEYTASINETAEILEEVITVLAHDDDVGDDVKYSILGSFINNLLTIGEDSGIITTRIDGAFDYETQRQVVFQVQATDTMEDDYGTRNSAIAQITINVQDVNDETPQISVGSVRVEVEENVEDGFEFLNNTVEFLIGTDDDEGADLIFSIDWQESYATKTGRRLTDEAFAQYEGCVHISTDSYSTPGNGQAVIAGLTTIEVMESNTPDYELFDILYLSIVITDRNQEVNDNSSSVIVPIYILDINDEPPVFLQSTIDSTKTVNENADVGTVIAIIIATDVDSDEITYRLESGEDYAEAVAISEIGELYVNGDIDADDPPLYTMNFTVIASDGFFNTSEEIVITVNDLNDNFPEFVFPIEEDNFDVYEEADDGLPITTLYATDIDRDPSNSQVTYQFSNTMDFQLTNYFGIGDNGLEVKYANPDDQLDRDNAKPGVINTIRVVARDSNMNDPKSSDIRSFTVTLLDINNQVPEITSTQLEASESLTAGDVIGQLQAEDKDKENTENTQVGFNYIGASAIDGKEPPEEIDMFALDLESMDIDARTVNLLANMDLRTYYGTYVVYIEAYDFGVLPGPLSDTYEITVEIGLYNFENPTFVYPEDDSQRFFLSKDQEVNSPLFLYNMDQLADFSATDSQDNKYEEISFTVSSDSGIFSWRRTGVRSGRLEVTTLEYEDTANYTVTITAEAVGATPIRTASIDMILQFVDTTANPEFYNNIDTISFLENETDSDQIKEFGGARFIGIPDDLLEGYKVYYIIYGENPGGFAIEDNTINRLTAAVMLDREETSNYTLLIQSSQNAEGVANPTDESLLTLTIVVEDVNDNPPNFDSSVYYAGVMSTWDVGATVLTIGATDLDENDLLVYNITDYTNRPTNINNEEPMEIIQNEDVRTATIRTNIAIPENADGYFLLNVNVYDGRWYDTATVKIYVITETHRVEFVFQNEYNAIFEAQDRIRIVLQNIFGYSCGIEAVVQNTDDDGNILENETVIRVHFIDSEENLAIDRSEIEALANDITLLNRLQSEFDVYNLVLLRFLNTSSSLNNLEAVFKAWLIAVCVVLGVLLLVLIIIFVLKTRSLSQRLNKLSVIRYASQESGLNRKVAPTTNKHTIEGSNPAYSEEKVNKIKDFDDTASIDSGDSDLVGIENNPEFEPKTKQRY